jgi:D-alanine-D-alanine ligase
VHGRLKIAVLYEPTDNTGAPEEEGKLTDREEVSAALRECGHEPFFHELKDEASLLALRQSKADLVFNMTEAFAGDDSKEAHVAAFLELLNLRYTGASPQALFLAQDKTVAKKIFDFHRLRTPRFASSYKGKLEHADDLEFPLIVKPASEDGSVGIDNGSVVHSVKELMERIAQIQEKFDSAALIEEFIDGRELYVGVLGNDKPNALPVVELDLSNLPEGMAKIAGQEVKWAKGSDAYEVTKSAAAKGLDEETTRRLQDTAVQVYSALKLRDYGRVDMRLDMKGRIYVIEANPNPWLSPEAELAIAAGLAGRSYVELIGQIVELSLARYPA